STRRRAPARRHVADADGCDSPSRTTLRVCPDGRWARSVDLRSLRGRALDIDCLSRCHRLSAWRSISVSIPARKVCPPSRFESAAVRRGAFWQHAWNSAAPLPAYRTRHGVLRDDDPRVAVSPPLMWVEALDLMMGAFANSGLDRTALAAVAGSAQQHGSVYLR